MKHPRAIKDYEKLKEHITQEYYDSRQKVGLHKILDFGIHNYLYLEEIPQEIALLKDTICSLHLGRLPRLKSFPEELEDFVRLQELYLFRFKKLPKGMEYLSQISALYAIGNPFLKNTAWKQLQQLPRLKHLNLNGSLQNFDFLPNELCQLTQLEELNLADNSLTCLPPEFQQLSQLKYLNLSNNNFDYLPRVLIKLCSLEHLIIDAKMLQGDYPILLQLKSIKKLQILGTTRTQTSIILSLKKLLKASQKYRYTKTTDNLLLALIIGKKQIVKLSNNQLYTVIQSHLNEYVHLALNELSNRSSQLLPNTLKKGSKIVIDGKLNSKISDLKIRLEKLGISIGKKIDQNTTHILIGKQPKIHYKSIGLPLLTEQLLLIFLDKLTAPYLLSEETSNIEGIKNLLCSYEEENIWLAIEILRSGGTPKSLKEELFFLYKTIKNVSIKKAIIQILGQLATPHFLEIINSRKTLMTSHQEETITKNLLYFCDTAQLDKNKMAHLVLDRLEMGLHFALWHLSTPDKNTFVQKYMQLSTTNYQLSPGTLSLDGINWKKLPKDFHLIDNIKILHLPYIRISTIPSVLFQLKELEELHAYSLSPEILKQAWQNPYIHKIFIFKGTWMLRDGGIIGKTYD